MEEITIEKYNIISVHMKASSVLQTYALPIYISTYRLEHLQLDIGVINTYQTLI